MKVEKKPMTLAQKIFYIISFSFLIIAFIYLGTRNYKVKELPDNQLFCKEYKNISSDNHFQVLDSEEALTFLERGTGIIFFGFPENKWSASIAELLNIVSKKTNYPINYFNFYKERTNRHDNYLGIVREIDDYLKSTDEGKLDIYAPTVVGIIKGKVIYFDDKTTFMDGKLEPQDYWTNSKKEEQLASYEKLIIELKAKSNEK